MMMSFEIKRDFIEELLNANFKRCTYTIYNKLDDEGYIETLEKIIKEPLSIEDFEYHDFILDEKEAFLLKMRNKNFTDKLKTIKNRFICKHGVKLIVEHDNGLVRVVKLKSVII